MRLYERLQERLWERLKPLPQPLYRKFATGCRFRHDSGSSPAAHYRKPN
jgi:hypothetical protein